MERREFIFKSSMMGAGMLLSPTLVSAASRQKKSANDKIGVGLIGCRSMGFTDLREFLTNPEVECVALCDVDQSVLEKRTADVDKIQGRKPKGIYKDWRRLIDDKHVKNLFKLKPIPHFEYTPTEY